MSTWAAHDDHAVRMAWRNFNQRYGLHVLYVEASYGGRKVFIDNEPNSNINGAGGMSSFRARL
jgi:hypothetical protein